MQRVEGLGAEAGADSGVNIWKTLLTGTSDPNDALAREIAGMCGTTQKYLAWIIFQANTELLGFIAERTEEEDERRIKRD